MHDRSKGGTTMKKLNLSILILAAASFNLATPKEAAAQAEIYSVSLPANQVAQLNLGRAQTNKTNCAKGSLPADCTQQQLCTALNIGTPGACTAGEANAAGIRIYNNNQPAREAFLTLELVKPPLASFVQKQAEEAMAALRQFCLAANQTQKDGVCTASGQSAGCGICDAFQ